MYGLHRRVTFTASDSHRSHDQARQTLFTFYYLKLSVGSQPSLPFLSTASPGLTCLHPAIA